MKHLACALAFVHLMLVASAITYRADGLVRQNGWAPQFLALYSGFTYALWRFGFFAPDVGKSGEVEIVVRDDSGGTHRYNTLEGFRFFTANHESANRFYVFKRMCARQEGVLDLCARSLATRMLNLHPTASEVDFTIRTIQDPLMADYVRNPEFRAAEMYSTTFARSSRPSDSAPTAPAPPESAK